MKKIVLCVLLLGLVSCQSSTVKMSGQETQSFLTDNPEILNNLRNNAEPEIRYKHRYYYCDKAKLNPIQSDCMKIECSGIHDNPNCWKTPITEEEYKTYISKYSAEVTKEEKSVFESNCLSNNTDLKLKHDACFNFLKSAVEKKMTPPMVEKVKKAFTQYCQLENVSCRLNDKLIRERLDPIKSRQLFRFQKIILIDENGHQDIYQFGYLE